MLKFGPPIPAIRQLVKYHQQPLEDLPDAFIQEVKSGLARYRSESPSVSIVLIAFNEEDYLIPCLASFANMDLPFPTELLVVNNNSNDRTQEYLDHFGVSTVFEAEPGWGAARNAGLKKARGKYIATGDTDNLYPPQWLATLIKPLTKDEEIKVTCGNYCFYTLTDSYGLQLQWYQQLRWFNSLMRQSKRPHLNCLGGCMAFRLRDALAVGGYRAQGRAEDGTLAYDLSAEGRIELINSPQAFAYSNLRTVMQEGSLTKAFWQRLQKHGKRLFSYLKPQ